jgi:hypothetical protein
VLGREGSSNAGVSKLNLVVTNPHSSNFSALSHTFLVHLIHQLNLFTYRHSDVSLDFVQFFVELKILLFLFFFLLHDFADIRCTNNCNADVCISEASNIVCSIASVDDASLFFFEIFDDDFFIVRRGSRENANVGIVVMR